MAWICPDCGREFLRERQSHSCLGAGIEQMFRGEKEKWLPLYRQLLEQAQQRLGSFQEFYPSTGVIWRHPKVFASVKCKRGALEIAYYADRLHPEREPFRTLQNSKNRIWHTVEITDNSQFAEILEWLAESYVLTMG